jgi:type II secretory pathway pseudopilin PulG
VKRPPSKSAHCFSLVEVTIALGVAALSLIAIFGLLPIGVETNRNAASQTAAANILAGVTADMRATPNDQITSRQYQVTFGAPQTIYFDEVGHFAPAPMPTAKYRLDIAYPPGPGLPRAATYVRLGVSWPARSDPARAAGRVQLFAAFDRH